MQRWAGDVGKSAESLRNWGAGEGDDLGVSALLGNGVVLIVCRMC